MTRQHSRRFLGGILALLMICSSFSFVTHPVSAASQTGVMIALYTYPDSTWDVVANAKAAHPSVPVVAIINPNNGPGSSRDANYVAGIQKLHAAGVVVLGYDATGYASNAASSVKSVMNTWKSLYTIDGIFFDEMANWSGAESYYSGLTSYAKSLGYTMTVGNPGTDTLSSYIGTVDNLMIYENPGLPPISALQGWHTGYDKSNFSMIAFGVNSISTSFLTSASNYVGYIDLTNDALPNPYDSVPSYFGTLVADLDTGGSTATVPSAPTGLAASAISSSQINLSWTAPNNGGSAIAGYKIERSVNAGSTWGVLVANTGNTGVTFSDTGLASTTAYTYRVSAINAIGTGSPSNISSATTSGTTAPSSPTGLASTAVSSSQINLSWTAPSNGGSAITGYKMERSTDSGSTWGVLVANTASAATTYSDTGLTASTAYTYRVSAINSIGTSSPSGISSATTSGTTTTPVTVTINSVDLSGSPIDGLYTTIQSGSTTLTTGYTPLSYAVTSGSQYVATVANYQNYVFNHWDNGSTNANRTITPTQNVVLTAYYSTGSTATAPSSPTGLASTAVSSSQINLSWTAPSNGGSAITGYKMERSTDSGSTWGVLVANTGNTGVTYSDTGLVASKAYLYRVSAINAIGTSLPSNTASATTSASTTVTVTVKTVGLGGNKITGLWTTLISGGTTIKSGYTTKAYSVTAGSTYTVTVSNYQNYVFDHWSDGSTNAYRTITPTQSVTLIAYYQQ